MNSLQAIEFNTNLATMLVTSYLEDMTDDELMKRPHPKANHIKWQLGHVISSDYQMVNGCCEGALPELPEGFAEKYTKETAASDDASQFHSKEEYLELFKQQIEAIKEVAAGLSDEDFSKPTPEAMQAYAPTVGSAFLMIGSHWIMHTGQWVILRRQLGRDPLF